MAHIGLDLDNTIIDYDAAFLRVGVSIGILSSRQGLTGKAAVKAHLLAQVGGMDLWMRLQGQVYGSRIGMAVPYAGATDFIGGMLRNGHRVTIISHKTKFGHFDESGTCLWDAARSWLIENNIVTEAQGGLRNEDVIFVETRDAKVEAIKRVGCDVFIDDLLEVLLHANFPETVERIWFGGRDDRVPSSPLHSLGNWMEIGAAVARHLDRRK